MDMGAPAGGLSVRVTPVVFSSHGHLEGPVPCCRGEDRPSGQMWGSV